MKMNCNGWLCVNNEGVVSSDLQYFTLLGKSEFSLLNAIFLFNLRVFTIPNQSFIILVFKMQLLEFDRSQLKIHSYYILVVGLQHILSSSLGVSRVYLIITQF